jgi:microcystin-dependent protein
MIMMHSGITPIPEGWAICDGSEYTFNGVTSTTPDLRNKFIKAVATVSEIQNVNNPDLTEYNEFTLTEEHLPKHSHPH